MSEERNTFINGVRESFHRLELKHRQREEGPRQEREQDNVEIQNESDMSVGKSLAQQMSISEDAALTIR